MYEYEHDDHDRTEVTYSYTYSYTLIGETGTVPDLNRTGRNPEGRLACTSKCTSTNTETSVGPKGTYSYTYSYTRIGETGTVPGPEQDREESGREIGVYE